MATLSGGEKLQAALRELSEKVSKKAVLRVGFLEGATYPSGESVAAVASFNEFGVPSHGQPPRPFFRGMIRRESGHWGSDLGKILKATGYDASRSLSLTGEEIKGELQQSIVDYEGPPLSPATIAAKGSEKQLVDTGHMLNSVDWDIQE